MLYSEKDVKEEIRYFVTSQPAITAAANHAIGSSGSRFEKEKQFQGR